jgi:ATP-binding cassette subfamily B (MDR/TAP) protein 1
MATSQSLGFFIQDSITACASLGVAFYISWKLTFVILASLPIAVVFLGLNARRMQPFINSQKVVLSKASKYAHTAITCIDTVKSYNGQNEEIWQYKQAMNQSTRWYLKQAQTSSLQMAIIRFVVESMFVQGFWYGVILVKQGINAGDVLTCFYACLMATQAGEAILPQWLILAKGASAGATLKTINRQMKLGGEVAHMGGSLKPDRCYGDIKVSNVSLSTPFT